LENVSERFESVASHIANSGAGPRGLHSTLEKHIMRAITILEAASIPTVLAATLLFAPAAQADDEPSHRLGDHPAVVVQRLYKAAGYDYASKFYPHPAGLRWVAQPPRDESDEMPAAGVADADQRAVRLSDAAARRPGTGSPRR
jgi:hypothetical protein